MVCTSCTLFHPQGALVCERCGQPFYGKLQLATIFAAERAPTIVGVASGVSLLACLLAALALPAAGPNVLGIGAYIGIISITNIWLSAWRTEDRSPLGGMRGAVFGAALLVSLVGELARLHGLSVLQLPTLSGSSVAVSVPSALAMDLVAGMLVVADPFVVRPLIKWIEDGVVRSEPE